ncbi:hypothetical protein BGX30_004929 [Mortierella sp. GBA39]|nr:hypothetical protein BGX30_004929 [Mortierella sp. GBA39]
MDSLSHLPIECLQHILQNLLDSGSLSILASLLTMNKHIASVTLPYLYCNPYHLILNGGKPSKRKNNAGELLTRTLLSCLPLATLPKALVLALTTDHRYLPPPTTASPLDYLAHVRHLNMDTSASLTTGCSLSTLDIPPEQLAYIRTEEFKNRYRSNPFSARYIDRSRFDTNRQILLQFFHVVLHQEAVWYLAHPILEQLQSFTIPFMSTIKQYHEVVDRFKSLVTIRFAMSEKYDVPYNNLLPPEKGSNDDIANQDMVRFVQAHALVCKGRLRSVVCLEISRWGSINMEYADGIRRDIFQLLPPLSKPTRLTMDNWVQFSAHPESTDLTRVREFVSEGMPKSWEDIIFNDRSPFQRCRALERLDVDKIHAKTFKWAVQEKRDLNGTDKNIAIGSSHGRRGTPMLEETAPPLHQTHGLVPLEVVKVRRLVVPGADDINDILFAFSHSLRDVSINTQIPVSLNLPKSIQLGQGWIDLPILTRLSLNLGSNRLVVDSEALSRCPSLTLLRLRDLTLEYSCQDIVPCPPAHLDQLDFLHLSGWPALTFDPATLSSATRLTYLSIQVRPWHHEHFDQAPSFIPPVVELDRSYGFQSESASTTDDWMLEMVRPLWTWDWHFPLLTSLSLSSEFAFLFEFRMLSGCPALRTMTLDMRSSTSEEHTRRIADEDLWIITDDNANVKDLSDQPSTPSSQLTTEFLCAPALTQLELNGEWVIENDIMPDFLTGMFPRVTDMYLNGWTSTTTVESLFELVRAMPSRYDETVSLHISDFSQDDMDRLGIVDYDEDEDDRTDSLAVNISNYDNSVHYLLLKDLPE